MVTIASHARGQLRLGSHGAERIRGRGRVRGARRGHRKFSPEREWQPPARLPLAGLEQPSAVEVIALIGAGGPGRRGDDRLEAHVNALVHVIYAKAHAECHNGSARFATTAEQLMVPLAQQFGIWGAAPPRETPEREAWVRKHRPVLWEWLEVLRVAGLISQDSRGVRDNKNIWWRTEITVLAMPEIDPDALAAAQARYDAFPARERDRQRRGRQTYFAKIYAAVGAPSAASKKRVAIERAKARAHARRISQNGNSGSPFGPSLPSEATEAPQELPKNQTFDSPYTSLDKKGVRERPRPGKPGAVRRLRRGDPSAHTTSPDSAQTANPRQDFPAVSEGGQAFGEQQDVPSFGPLGRMDGPLGLFGEERALWAAEAVRLAQTAKSLGPDADLTDPPTLEAVTVGWYVERYGLDWVAERGPDGLARVAGAHLAEVLGYYDRHLSARPAELPACGLAALRLRAIAPAPPYQRRIRQRDGRWRTITVRPELSKTIGHALQGVRMMARDLAAAEKLLADAAPALKASDELASPQPPAPGALRMQYRAVPDRKAWDEKDEAARRKRVRTQLGHAGGNPRHFDTLEEMELELLEREHRGLLPARYAYPSPTAMRAHRGAWMPAWYRPTPSETSPVDAWNQLLAAAAGQQTSPNQTGPFAPVRWIDDTELELWLSALSPIELADDTLTVAGPRNYAQHARQRHHAGLQQLAQTLGIARRLQITDLEDYTGGAHHTPPRPPVNDPGADGTRTRARRHLRLVDHERRRLLAERDATNPATELIARRNSATPANEAWDELCDIAATRPEFRGPVVVTSWLRTLLPHWDADGTLTLTGPAHQIDNARKHLGPQLEHLIAATGRARTIVWAAW